MKFEITIRYDTIRYDRRD